MKQTSMHLSIPPSFQSRLDFIEFEKKSVAAILGSNVGNGQGARAQQIDTLKVRATRRHMKLQGVSREQFHIHAIGVSFISATQCFHRLSADEREDGEAVSTRKKMLTKGNGFSGLEGSLRALARRQGRFSRNRLLLPTMLP